MIAYKVNVKDIGSSQEVILLTNQSYTKGTTIVGNLIPGEKVTESQVEITVLASTAEGDYVKIAFLAP